MSSTTPQSALRFFGFGYACLAYVAFYGAFGFFVLTTMGYTASWEWSRAPEFDSPLVAALFNLSLVVAFGLQHSVMARPRFKAWLTRLVPPALERSTFVWVSNLSLAGACMLWAPVPGAPWTIAPGPIATSLWALGAVGWAGVAGSSFLIDHFELFGLQQSWSWLAGREAKAQPFRTPGAYRVVRHPMMLSMVVGLWATPEMSTVRLLLAAGMTAYIATGIRFEERDLVRLFGDRYRAYQNHVPALFPRPYPRPVSSRSARALSTTREG